MRSTARGATASDLRKIVSVPWLRFYEVLRDVPVPPWWRRCAGRRAGRRGVRPGCAGQTWRSLAEECCVFTVPEIETATSAPTRW